MEKENNKIISVFIGKKIRDFRIEAKMKQEDMGAIFNLTRASIVNIELGRQSPKAYMVYILSCIFDKNISDFYPDKKELLIKTKKEKVVTVKEVLKLRSIKIGKIE